MEHAIHKHQTHTTEVCLRLGQGIEQRTARYGTIVIAQIRQGGVLPVFRAPRGQNPVAPLGHTLGLQRLKPLGGALRCLHQGLLHKPHQATSLSSQL